MKHEHASANCSKFKLAAIDLRTFSSAFCVVKHDKWFFLPIRSDFSFSLISSYTTFQLEGLNT